jgi:hypothetical protein
MSGRASPASVSNDDLLLAVQASCPSLSFRNAERCSAFCSHDTSQVSSPAPELFHECQESGYSHA